MLQTIAPGPAKRTRVQLSPVPNGVALSPLEALAREGDRSASQQYEGLAAELYSWETLPLAINTISKTVPPILHFTGKKGYREMWWPRNWFYPYQAQILRALRRRGPVKEGRRRESVAGAWTYPQNATELGWKDWEDGLCGQFEEQLQGRDWVDDL